MRIGKISYLHNQSSFPFQIIHKRLKINKMKSIKSIILVLSVLFLGLTSCGGGSKTNDTHTHDDGSVHQDHSTETAKPAEQESFKVEADTLTSTANPAHEHGDDAHGHDHGDGNVHKH